MKITQELLEQATHIGFLKFKDATNGNVWNKLKEFSLASIESQPHLNLLQIKIHTSDEMIVIDRECINHLYLLDNMSVVWYIPIIDIVDKALLSDGTFVYKIICKDIYPLESETYDFMFYKEYLAQFNNTGISLWNYNKRQIDDANNKEDVYLTVYNKEIKNINLKSSRMFKVELRLDGMPQRENILKEND